MAAIPDIRLKQSARFPQGQVQVTVPDLFSDWVAPTWVDEPDSAPSAPGYETYFDWKVTDGVIDETQALATAVMVALGSNHLADISDELPDPLDNDRHGWWADMDAESIWTGWPLGTRLWEMRRDALRPIGYKNGATAIKAEMFVREAIRPFEEAAIISNYTVEVDPIPRMERIDVLITLIRTNQPAIKLEYQYLYGEIGKTTR